MLLRDRCTNIAHKCPPGCVVFMWYLVRPYLFIATTTGLASHAVSSFKKIRKDVPNPPPVHLTFYHVPIVQLHRAICCKEPGRHDEHRELRQREQHHVLKCSAPRRVQRYVYTPPRRCPLSFLVLDLGPIKDIDEGEARRTREEVALVLEERIRWEVCADGEQEDGEVQ